MSINKVILVGNVGKTPEVRQVGENKVASFTLATTEKFKDREETEWHNIVVWGKQAEVVEKYVDKGTQLYVEGRIKTEKYTKDGQDRFIVKIYANTIQLLGKRESQPTAAPAPSPAPQARVQGYHTTPIVDDLPPDDSGLPF